MLGFHINGLIFPLVRFCFVRQPESTGAEGGGGDGKDTEQEAPVSKRVSLPLCLFLEAEIHLEANDSVLGWCDYLS